MPKLKRAALQTLRKVAGKDTEIERRLRQAYWASIDRVTRGRVGTEHLIFGAKGTNTPKLGIYAYGSCDLPSVLACKPAIREAFPGTCCIQKHGKVAHARSDLILQTLDGVDAATVAEVVERLRVPADVYEPRLFEPQITPDTRVGDVQFPKDVVILSIGADVTRSLYRHRKTGVLMDPGGGWLNQQVQFALDDHEAIRWAAAEFESVGRLSVEQSMDNFRRIIEEVRKRTGAHVLVFNLLTVEPGSKVNNLQFLSKPLSLRVREFNVALGAVAEDLDVAVVDVDRVLKGLGVADMVDFVHNKDGMFPRTHYAPLAAEVMRILHELDVFEKAVERGPDP